MKNKKKLSGEAMPSEKTASNNTVHRKANIPDGDINFLSVAETVAASWAANTAITLLWTNHAEFSSNVNLYSTILNSRLNLGAGRPVATKTMKNLDKEIDTGVEEVKTYIGEKYGRKNAQSHYNTFGIAHHGHNWKICYNRPERSLKLAMMVDAIAANGFGSKEYGTAFWTATLNSFNTALANAGAIDQQVSGDVAQKNTLKKSIKKTMIALRFALRASYPDTYQAVYREWGWIKD